MKTGRKSLSQRFWEKVDAGGRQECWPWNADTCRHGYGRISVYGKPQPAHRVSYTLFYGGIPDGMCVCHACDNPICVNPFHLWLGTPADNAADKMRKGRHRTGPVRRKLTDADAEELRAARVAGAKYRVLADRYGIAITTAARVADFTTYKKRVA